jgi:3'(2'), 5'-bisphosphate nucleotidase
MSYTAELEAALEAADLAGRLVREQYDRWTPVPDAPADITTATDHAAQELILGHLHRAFPADAFCAEEMTPTLGRVSTAGSRIWIIDPIDGTRGFARKNGEFSVMIGLADRGRPVVGVVYEPAKGRLTYAARGTGCWVRDGSAAESVRGRVSTQADLSRAVLTQSHSSANRPASPELAALKPGRVIETYSAGVKMAQVARGEADLYLNTYPAFSDWDICAGHALIDEAGGKATGLGGQELHYGQPRGSQVYGLLATNGLVHEAAVAALRQAGRAR